MGNKKNIIYSILVIAIVIIIYFAYREFAGGKFSTENTSGQSATQAGQKILTRLNELKHIDLEGSIFKNSVFLALKDFSVTVGSQTVGRQNPFAPIGDNSDGDFGTTTTVTSGTPPPPTSEPGGNETTPNGPTGAPATTSGNSFGSGPVAPPPGPF